MMKKITKVFVCAVILFLFSQPSKFSESFSPCPCVSHLNFVNYTCFYQEIEKNGPVNNSCLDVLPRIDGTNHSQYMDFRIIELDTFNCTDLIANHSVYDRKNTTRAMNSNDCSAYDTRLYEIISYGREFYDFLEKNVVLSSRKLSIDYELDVLYLVWDLSYLISKEKNKSYVGEFHICDGHIETCR